MDFIADILAKLDDQDAKTKINDLIKPRDINLTAKIDDTQIKNIARNLSQNKALQITAHIKDTSLKNMQNQLNAMSKGLNINLGNAFNINNTANSAKKYGQQVGNLISSQAQNAIKNVSSTGINKYFKVSQSDSDAFRKEMDKLVSDWTNGKGKLTDVKIQTRTSYDKDAQRNIERLHQAQVTYNNELGESIKKTIAWRQVGTTQDKKGNDVPIRGFVEVASQYSKTLDKTSTKTDNFIKTQQKAINKFSNQSKDIYRDAIDKNASKPIKDQLHLDEINKRYKEINTEIGKLNNLSGTDFSNQENYINSLISDLKIYKREVRNAESTATALRSKPIDVVRDETSNKVKGLEADIKKAGVSSKELTDYIDSINKALSNPNIDASGINNVLNTMSKAREEMNKLKKESSSSQSLQKAQIKSDGLTKDIQKAVSDNLNLGNFETEINGAKVSVTSLLNELSQVKTTGDVSVVTEKWKSFSSAAKEAGVMAESAVDNVRKLEKYTDTFDKGKYSADSKSMSASLEKYSGQNTDSLEKARNYLKEYQDTYKEIQNHFDQTSSINFKDDELVQKFDKLETAASKYKNVMREVSTESSKTLSENAGIIKSNEIWTYYNNNTKAVKKYGAALRELAEDAKNATTQAKLDEINDSFKKLKSTISAEGLTGKSPFDEAKRAFFQIAEFTGMYGILQNVIQDIPRAMVQAVKDVDTAMTNLYKVTDETDKKYQSFLKNAGTAAKELGRDMSSYITQTSEWAKLGYTMDQSSELAKLSSIYSNVGEVDDKTAVSDMVTAMKAFNIESSNAVTIIDSLNALGNNFATSSADLGEGLSKSASSMNTAGVDLAHTLAMLTGGAEITQNAGEFGNFLKVASMRIRGMTGDLEALGEEVDPAVDSISKVQTQILNLTKGKVNIFDSNDEFRDYFSIMQDIASIHNQLSSTDQAALDEILFGKQRANQGAALIQAFQSGQIQKAYETAMNSENSAMEEQLRWMDSIEAKQQQLSAAFQNLSTTVINSDFLKSIIDTGTNVLEVLDWIIDKFGILQTLIGGFAVGKGITSFAKSFDKPACIAG